MRFPQSPAISIRTPESFGLFGIIETKRVILPLKGVECDFSVVSGIAEVAMTQVFRQDNTKPLDCEYLFPLPSDASVYHCEADINGRTIKAQVRERQEARELAAEKKAAGFRTALVESERDNLFTLSLGNVQPNDLVVIQLKYFQTLRSLAGAPSIEIPFCPGVRYIPGKPLLRSNQGKGTVDDTDQVPDASRITPVRIDGEHPDAAYIEVRGTLDGKFVNEHEVVSPSHPLSLQRIGDQLRVTLSEKGDVPDRDFVLRWSERNAESVSSRAWFQRKGAETYALLEVRAPKNAPAERAPADFYFLVDRSGSMAGEKWTKATEALLSCVKVLDAADRIMVTFFENRFQDFAERPMTARELLKDRNFLHIKDLGARGGTEMQPALQHVLEIAGRHSQGRHRNLILITDAQIGNESAILHSMRTAPDLAVHCFGIDVALNDSLLLALTRQQGGTFHSLNPGDDIEKAVANLGQTLAQPVLLDLQLPEGWECADARIPNLYAGQIHYLSARSCDGNAHRESPVLELSARNAASELVNIQFQTLTAAVDAPYLHWCKSRIQRLVAESKQSAAIALSIESNLICRLTAFIAWDESEKVEVATHELVQPAMEPQRCGFVGAGAPAGKIFAARKMAAASPAPDVAGLDGMLCDLEQAPDLSAGKRPRMGLFRKFTQNPAPDQVRETPALDEVGLKRELSDICHRMGVVDWQPLVKAILDWIAAAKPSERIQRITQANSLLSEIQRNCGRVALLPGRDKPAGLEKLRKDIQQQLKSFVDKLHAATAK